MLKRSHILIFTATALLTLSACNQEEKQTEASNAPAQTTTTTATSSEKPVSPAAKATAPAAAKTTPAAAKTAAKTAAKPATKPADKDTDSVANRDPDFIKAMQLLNANRPADAIGSFDVFLKAHPGDIQGLNNRGVAYMRINKFDMALKDFNQVIQLYPDRPSFYYNRATLALMQKQDPLPDLSKTISIDPTFLPALYDRANLYYTRKQYDKGIQDLTQILKFVPKNPDSYNFRGFLLMQKGKLPEAEKDFDQALKLNPRFGLAMANKAQALYKQGQCPAALDWLKKSCQAGHKKGCQLLKQIKCK